MLSLGLIGCSTQSNTSQIRGVISDLVEQTVEIGGETLEVSEKGEFNFERDIERPLFLDVSYGSLEWTIFLMPNSSLKVEIHQQNQVDYIATIDSLKGLYLEHLTADPLAYPTFSTAFVKAWKTEINFALNKIMLYYPKNHFYYTGETV